MRVLLSLAVLSILVYPTTSHAQWTQPNGNVVYSGTGNVGIGTATPTSVLHVFQNSNANSFLMIENTNLGLSAAAVLRAKADVATVNFQSHASTRTLSRFGVSIGGWSEFLQVAGNGLLLGSFGNVPVILGTNSLNRVHISGGGNVGIGTASPTERLHVAGNLLVTGDITGAKVVNAVYQDVAEWVTSDKALAPGNLVIVATGKVDQVVASSEAYDTRVAGVVSEKPGVLLGVPGESKVKVATMGRVRVRVDATINPIEAGDILVSSDKPGTAMKSVPVDVAGIKLHRPGTVIGKALEALPSGEGEILVLLSMQ